MGVPASVAELAERFHEEKRFVKSSTTKEHLIRRAYIDPLFSALGWDVDYEKGGPLVFREVVEEDSLRVEGAMKAPDYGFYLGGRRKAMRLVSRHNEEVRMNEEPTTQTAQIRRLEQTEDAEIPLFEVPFDGLIVNVAFTPSEDVRGAYYSRQLNLNVRREGAHHHVVGAINLTSDEWLLPGGERHNAPLFFPASSLRVLEGDVLVWSSIGSVGEGLVVPESSIEISFERKQIAEDLPNPELWAECVPDYWTGRKVFFEYQSTPTPAPDHPGASSAYIWEHTGTFLEANPDVVAVAVEPLEHGRLPRDTGFRWEQLTRMKLMEDA